MHIEKRDTQSPGLSPLDLITGREWISTGSTVSRCHGGTGLTAAMVTSTSTPGSNEIDV